MTYYDDLLKSIEEHKSKGRRLIKKRSEVKLERVEIRSNAGAWLASPLEGFDLACIDLHISEIPPGGHTGMHRHFNEAIIHIVMGRGYSLIDDERVEWEEGDTLVIPVFAWHQHFNTDPERPARYIAATNVPLMERLHLAKIEHR